MNLCLLPMICCTWSYRSLESMCGKAQGGKMSHKVSLLILTSPVLMGSLLLLRG